MALNLMTSGLPIAQHDSSLINAPNFQCHTINGPFRPEMISKAMVIVAQADITVNGTGHYNPDNDALLRFECMSAKEVRVSLPRQDPLFTLLGN